MFISSSEEETVAIAKKIADTLKQGDCLTLQGEVGAGKTVFARALIQHLYGSAVQVNSPTFTLVQTYPVTLHDGTRTTLYHYDLYRLQHPSELLELALDEALSEGVVVMEWPELAAEYLPDNTMTIRITAKDETMRMIEVMSYEL